ncbi:MAG: hypothetical protein EON95_11485 [Caulobacteraceae bacterium]|nr:MAG: hypothetical protein EON95_11485 [Caulobacteraceae bacterium]
MSRLLGLTAALLIAASPLAAQAASNWKVVGAPGEAVFALTAPIVIDKGVNYTFQCEADSVAIMQTGVSDLLPPAEVPLVMGLLSDKADLVMKPAAGRANPKGGQDLMIRLSKKDKAIRTLGEAKMISLATTGFTAAVSLDDQDRSIIAGFVDRCLKG